MGSINSSVSRVKGWDSEALSPHLQHSARVAGCPVHGHGYTSFSVHGNLPLADMAAFGELRRLRLAFCFTLKQEDETSAKHHNPVKETDRKPSAQTQEECMCSEMYQTNSTVVLVPVLVQVLVLALALALAPALLLLLLLLLRLLPLLRRRAAS